MEELLKLDSAIDKLAPALVAAQAELQNPAKTKTVHAGQKKYSFAPLPEIIDAVRPVLAKHGLAVVQMVTPAGLDTRLLHLSGQQIGAVYPLPAAHDSQAMGSAITYARRYSLCAILGIAGEDDEDGQAQVDAAEAEEEARKAKAAAALDGLKQAAKEGRLKSAHTGKTMKPGEGPEPEAAELEDDDVGVTGPLAVLMQQEGITPEQLKAYYVGKGHLPKSVEPADIPADYVAVLTRKDNWAKAVAAMKGGK